MRPLRGLQAQAVWYHTSRHCTSSIVSGVREASASTALRHRPRYRRGSLDVSKMHGGARPRPASPYIRIGRPAALILSHRIDLIDPATCERHTWRACGRFMLEFHAAACPSIRGRRCHWTRAPHLRFPAPPRLPASPPPCPCAPLGPRVREVEGVCLRWSSGARLIRRWRQGLVYRDMADTCACIGAGEVCAQARDAR